MPPSPPRYFVINKPYNMVSQFVSAHNVRLLSQLDFNFPEGTHAIGRLDNHSEGLLLLTTDKRVTRLLFLSDIPHKRTYLVQINNILSADNLARLQQGVSIRTQEHVWYQTPPCDVRLVKEPEVLYDWCNESAAFGPHTWLQITLTEGKYHQVRKMIGQLHHRTKRLIRLSIENLKIEGLAPGQVRELEKNDFFKLLNIPLIETV